MVQGLNSEAVQYLEVGYEETSAMKTEKEEINDIAGKAEEYGVLEAKGKKTKRFSSRKK